MAAWLIVPLLAGALAGQAPATGSNAGQIALAPSQTIVEVDTGKLKGQPSMLAWSPDRSELYLQATDRNRQGVITSTKHYLVSVAGKTLKSIDEQPAWVSKYWLWKSAQASPGLATFKIEIENRQETKRPTAAPMGGDLAKGGGGSGDPRGNAGSTASDAAAASYGAQEQSIIALKLKGQTIGEWINEPVTPGTNFAWAPAPARMIVFTKRDGGPLVVLDDEGRKQELVGAKAATMPAWSNDGAKLAWLERAGKNRFALTVAEVNGR